MRQALILDVAKEAAISLSHHFDVEIAALCTNGRNKKAALQWPEARSMAAQGRKRSYVSVVLWHSESHKYSGSTISSRGANSDTVARSAAAASWASPMPDV